MTETCATCRFYERYSGEHSLKEGGCHRFPQHVFKDGNEHCGEHRHAGPADGDEYTRAAVEMAEAEAAWWHGDLGDPERRHMLHRAAKDARDAFLALYREREARRG